VADGGKRGSKQSAQAWQFGGPIGPASWPEITAQHNHLLLAGAILAIAFSVVFVSRQAAQSRKRTVGYCNRVPIMLRQLYTQQQQ
jgi:hypothetical protein